MAVKTQNISIDFGLGIDEFTDPKMVKEGKLLRARNVVFDEAKKISKRNGFKEVAMNETDTGIPMKDPKEIFKHNEKPVVFSKNKLYTSVESPYLSDVIKWRDSGEFNMPSKVRTSLVASWDTFKDNRYNFDGTAEEDLTNLSIASRTLETNGTLIKCTVYCSADRGGVGVVIKDVITEEILLLERDFLTDITHQSVGTAEQMTWLCPKIIPWRSEGQEPDRFMIVVSAKFDYDSGSDNINDVPTDGPASPYRVLMVTLDSLGGPSVSDEGDLFNFLGIEDPVYDQWNSLYIPESGFPEGNEDGKYYLRRKYSQFTDLVYRDHDSTAWFAFGGTGIMRITVGGAAVPHFENVMFDMQWGQSVYVLKIEQSTSGGGGFSGSLHARCGTSNTGVPPPAPTADELTWGWYEGNQSLIVSDTRIGNWEHYYNGSSYPVGAFPPPIEGNARSAWEVAFNQPNKNYTYNSTLDTTIFPKRIQKPRWGSSGVDWQRRGQLQVKDLPTDPDRYFSDGLYTVQPYNFDEIFRVSLALTPTPGGDPAPPHSRYRYLTVAFSTVSRGVDNDPHGISTIPPAEGEPLTNGFDAGRATRQRVFVSSVDTETQDLNIPKTQLTTSSLNLFESAELYSYRTPEAFVCTGLKVISPPFRNGLPDWPKRNIYLVSTFEEQINNTYIRNKIFGHGLTRGGDRGFFTNIYSIMGWNPDDQSKDDFVLTDVLTYTKPAAEACVVSYGPEDPDNPQLDREYIILPTVRKNISIMMSDIAKSADLYVLAYDAGPSDLALVEWDSERYPLDPRPHTISKSLDGRALGSVSDPISIGSTFCCEVPWYRGFGYGDAPIKLIKDRLIFDFPTFSDPNEVGINSIDIDIAPKLSSVEYGKNLYSSGGYLKCWNGQSYIENNFHFQPMIVDIDNVQSEPGYFMDKDETGKDIAKAHIPFDPFDFMKVSFLPASLLTKAQNINIGVSDAGSLEEREQIYDDYLKDRQFGDVLMLNPTGPTNPTYQFRFIMEWTDANGDVHLSPPSEKVHIEGKPLSESGTTITHESGDWKWVLTPLNVDMEIGKEQKVPSIEIGSASEPDPGPLHVKPTIAFRLTGLPPGFTEKYPVGSIKLKSYRTLNIVNTDAKEVPIGLSNELYEDENASVQICYDSSAVWKPYITTNAYTVYELNGYSAQPGTYGYIDWSQRSRLSVKSQFVQADDELGSKQRLLYTSYGDSSYEAAPPCEQLTEHDGRLFVLSSENPNIVNYSNAAIKKSAVQFNMFGRIEVKKSGGSLVGMASNAGKLVLFKESAIFIVYGTPVQSSGFGGGYSPPQEFSEDVGCTNSSSITETDEGVFFQSGLDIYLIDKGFGLNKIGIVAPLKEGQSIESIAKLPNSNEIRFCHNEGMLIYNTLFKQWTTSDLASRGSSIVLSGEQYLIENDSGKILKEEDSYYGDIGHPIVSDIETAWIKMNTPQGRQRIRNILFLGELTEDTKFDLEISYNYNDYPEDTVRVLGTDIVSLETLGGEGDLGDETYLGGYNTDRVFQFRHKPKIQKCESIKFRVVERGLTEPTKGYSLNTILLEVAPLKGGMKLRTSKTV